jgi:hypothetical protein
VRIVIEVDVVVMIIFLFLYFAAEAMSENFTEREETSLAYSQAIKTT